MARITEKDMEQAVAQMREVTGLPLEVEYSYGKGKIVRKKETGGYLNFSPTHLSNRDLMFWMDAFMHGWHSHGEIVG